MPENQSPKKEIGFFGSPGAVAETVGASPEERVVAALSERGPDGLSFAQMVEDGVLRDRREGDLARRRLLRAKRIRKVGIEDKNPQPHGCPSCRCGPPPERGRPRVLYTLIEEPES